MKIKTAITKQRNGNNTGYNRTKISGGVLTALFIIMMLCINAPAAEVKDKNAEVKNPNEARDLGAAEVVAGHLTGKKVKVDSVKFDDVLKMYRVEIKGTYFLITPDMKYAFIGDVVDIQTKKSILYAPLKVDFSSLPLQDAIKIGKGPNIIAMFMSLKCPHCHNQYKDLVKNENVTTYVFIYPGAEAVWCSPDKGKALDEAISKNGQVSNVDMKKCDVSALKRNYEFAQVKKIRSTPTLVYSDGDSTVGYIPAAKLNEILATKGNK